MGEIGEWGLLDTIIPRISSTVRNRFMVGPGDDAAILKTSARNILSIDGLVEGTHFEMKWARDFSGHYGFSFGRGLGWKLMGSCLSDLAAMGASKNRWVLLFLGAPPGTKAKFLEEIFQGIQESARSFNCVVAGGDTVQSKVLTLVAAVGGELEGDRPLTRKGARAGDLLCLAGLVGDASLGLAVQKGRGPNLSPAQKKYFVKKFYKHLPMFAAGKILQKEKRVTALLDLSDPLDQSVRILARASKVGLEVNLERIPRSKFFQSLPRKPAFAEMGGEDYSLLFTARTEALTRLARSMRFAVIGKVLDFKKGVRFLLKGREMESFPLTFQHFR